MDDKSKKPKIRFAGFNDEWEYCKLDDTSVAFEYGLNASATIFDGKNKYIRITDIDDDSRLFMKKDLTSPNMILNNSDRFVLKKGDILFARTGASVGKTYIYNESDGLVYFAGFLIRARIKDEFDTQFIFLNTLTHNYNKFVYTTSQRSGQPGINAQEYSEYSFNAPKYKEEQQKIGSVFSNIDNLINQKQKKYDKLVNIKKSMLEKMFPQNNSKYPEVRFDGFNDEWVEKRLGEIGSTYTGLSGKTKNDFGHGDGKFVTYMNVFTNAITDIEYTDKVEIDYSQNEVQYGDVFFTTSSETPNEVGMTSVWLGDEKNIYLNSFCFGYRPFEKFDNYFLAFALRSPAMREKISILAQGISRYNISKTKVMDIGLYIPTLEEQQKIGEYFQNLDNLINQQQKQLEKLKTIKKSLLENMFV